MFASHNCCRSSGQSTDQVNAAQLKSPPRSKKMLAMYVIHMVSSLQQRVEERAPNHPLESTTPECAENWNKTQEWNFPCPRLQDSLNLSSNIVLAICCSGCGCFLQHQENQSGQQQ